MIGQRSDRGIDRGSANAELATLWAQLQRAHPELNQKFRIRLVPYSATAGGNSIVATRGNRMLAIFSVVTLLTIVIVCANVTNLLIARAAARQREMAVRQSLGASRGRVVRGPARRRAGAVDRRVDRGLPVRVVGVAGGRAVPRA